MGDDLGHRLRTRVLTLLLRGLSATWRFRETVPPECAPVLDGRARGVVAFWHGKMLPVWYRFRGPRTGALVSMSRDGALLADYLKRGLGYGRVIRGSSSRSGGEALREMVELLGERTCLITPDGPRGPLHRAKPGALIAASRAGVPVVLAGWECRRVTVLRSWDRMEIPHPFARIDIRYCIFDGVIAVSEADAATGADDAAISSAGAATGPNDAAISDAGAARGAGDAAASDAGAARGAGDAAASDAGAARGAGDAAASDAGAARGDGDVAVSGAVAARGAGDAATSDAGAARGAGDAATSDAGAATGDSDAVASSTEAATGADDTTMSSAGALTGDRGAAVSGTGVATDAGGAAMSDTEAATDAGDLRDEQSQFDAAPGDTFAEARAPWIGPDVLERFDRALDALNGPQLSAGAAPADAASSRGSRRT
jgi:lysophospholipid acyltransferase (LPLAT)-like uncharacterized protein